jgi:hypothetical protein
MNHLYIDINNSDFLQVAKVFSTKREWYKCKELTLFISGYKSDYSTRSRLNLVSKFLQDTSHYPNSINLEFNIQIISKTKKPKVEEYNQYFEIIIDTITEVSCRCAGKIKYASIIFSSNIDIEQDKLLQEEYKKWMTYIWDNGSSPFRWEMEFPNKYYQQNEVQVMHLLQVVLQILPGISILLSNLFVKDIADLVMYYYYYTGNYCKEEVAKLTKELIILM